MGDKDLEQLFNRNEFQYDPSIAMSSLIRICAGDFRLLDEPKDNSEVSPLEHVTRYLSNIVKDLQKIKDNDGGSDNLQTIQEFTDQFEGIFLYSTTPEYRLMPKTKPKDMNTINEFSEYIKGFSSVLEECRNEYWPENKRYFEEMDRLLESFSNVKAIYEENLKQFRLNPLSAHLEEALRAEASKNGPDKPIGRNNGSRDRSSS